MKHREATFTAVVLTALLLCAAGAAGAQSGTVGGQVVSGRSLQPLGGVQVLVEGTGQGTLTDASGRFLLPALSTGTVRLRFLLIGYAPLTRSAEVGTTDLQVALAEQAVQLDEVVVTGTAGDARTRTLGNAVAQVDAAEVVARQPINNVQELINGRAPGVVITSPTGMVGGGSKIRIRGISSLSLSDQPLLYVDGVRVDNAATSGPAVQFFSSVVSRINDFNPEDIQSIEIIKGPAAATLYGTEASNGVIQIITKKGAVGEPRFDFKVRQGANWFSNAESRLPETYWRNPATNEVEVLNIVEQENARGTPIFRTGHLQSYDLSLGGGAESIRYYMSGSYERNEGAERDNDLTRWSGRANLAVAASDQIDISGNLGYTASHTDLSYEGSAGGTTWASYYASPARLTLRDGSPHPARGFRTATPEVYYDAFQALQEVGRFTGSVQIDHRPTSWFTHKATLGTDRTIEDNQEITERSEEFQFFFGTLLGFKGAGRRDIAYNTFDYSGTAAFGIREDLTSSTSVGAQYYQRFSESVFASGEQFPAPGLTVVDAAAIQRGSESFVENTTVGVYVQQQFGWRDRLFLTGAIRADDNSAFGENFDLVYYPKVSGSWVISEEPFWRLPFVNTFRLRAAYGESGQQPAAFAALRTYSPITGRGDVAAISPGTVGNPDLGPERGKEVEVGFDAGFLNQRVGLQFTYYNKRTTDGIVFRSAAPSAGFPGSQFVNIGEVANRGVELLLDGQLVNTPTLGWDLSLSFASNGNEVVEIGGGLDRLVLSSQFGLEHRVGFPASSFFHKRIVSADVNADGTTTNLMCDSGPENGGQTVPCSEAPLLYLGRIAPKYEGAVTSALTLFGTLRLNGLLDFKTGNHKWDGTTWVRCSIFALCTETAFPQDADPARLATFQRGLAIQSPYIRDASFATLRELSATYTLPARWAGRLGASTAALTVAGRNLYTWTEWPGLDPESAFAGGAWYEQNNLPQLAQFVTTINLSF